MSKTLERLAWRERATERPTGARSPNGPTKSLREAYRPSVGVSGPSARARLREAIETARHWGELEEALRNVDQAFQGGTLTLEEAEELALLVGGRGRELPEKAPDRAG